MKTTTATLALALAAITAQSALALPANGGPLPTLAARFSSAADGQAVVDDHTLTTGLNTVNGQTYTFTHGFVVGPTLTQGPQLQIEPHVTQAFGCQIVGNMKQGDCAGVDDKIKQALASVTGDQPAPTTTATTKTTSKPTAAASPTPKPNKATQHFGNQAVINGHTLTTGLNTVDAKTYTYTDGFLIGPSMTQGPNVQIEPRVTQAFGCQIVGRWRHGACDGVEAKISAALASVTAKP